MGACRFKQLRTGSAFKALILKPDPVALDCHRCSGIAASVVFVLGCAVAAALSRRSRLLLWGSSLWPLDTQKAPGYLVAEAGKQLRGVN